ncbi:CENP-S associating centromere protein X-domain-containing protein [Xylariaceae sp. FL0662B]|nr:CENP-S associating centromere protein X-domain-containing protein [Xylariaceae sp. FL0662B]
MPPKQSAPSSRGRGASSAGTRPPNKFDRAPKTQTTASSRVGRDSARSPQTMNSDLSDMDPFADEPSRSERPQEMDVDEQADEEGEEDVQKTIPPELLTRLLHEFFEKDGTRVSKDANAAIAKYMDIFVREAIARTAVEKESGFLEVEDLEKVAPQLLLDL